MNGVEYKAYEMVFRCQDDGAEWSKWMCELSFARAAEHARELRAFYPGRLFLAVAYPHLFEPFHEQFLARSV